MKELWLSVRGLLRALTSIHRLLTASPFPSAAGALSSAASGQSDPHTLLLPLAFFFLNNSYFGCKFTQPDEASQLEISSRRLVISKAAIFFRLKKHSEIQHGVAS